MASVPLGTAPFQLRLAAIAGLINRQRFVQQYSNVFYPTHKIAEQPNVRVSISYRVSSPSQSSIMEVLGGVANVLAVVDMAGKVLELCWNYYSSVKAAKTDIELLCNETTDVLHVFKQVEELMKDPQAGKLLASSQLIERTLSEIKKELESLITKLRPETPDKKLPWFYIRALKWPLTSADVDKTLRHLERQKTTLIAALNLDQTYACTRDRRIVSRNILSSNLYLS